MKAWVLHGINDLRLENIEKPLIADDEVLIEVKAAGICGSDIPRIYKTGAHTHPLVPGHEFAGVVKQCGKCADVSLLGERVGIFPLIPCKNCLPCRNMQYEMCRNYNYLGSRRDGGFAEYAAVPAKNLIRLPDNVSFEQAAMLEPMAVAAHAFRRISAKAPHTAVVCGLGTIGLLLVMLIQEAVSDEKNGFNIDRLLVIGNKEFQKQTVLKLGIKEENYCDSNTNDVNAWLTERTDGCGADILFECVGKNDTLTQVVNMAAPAGQICLVGNPYSDMSLEKSVYWKILRNQLVITGTWNSSFTGNIDDDWHYVLKRLEQKKIEPAKLISHRFALDELDEGLKVMSDKTEDYIKVMGVVS